MPLTPKEQITNPYLFTKINNVNVHFFLFELLGKFDKLRLKRYRVLGSLIYNKLINHNIIKVYTQ